MTPRDFVYWLQGYFELNDRKPLTKKQVRVIVDHIELVIEKKTPDRDFRPLIDKFNEDTLKDNPDTFKVHPQKVFPGTCDPDPWYSKPTLIGV